MKSGAEVATGEPRSKPYRPYLLERLADPSHSMYYLKAAMEDSYELTLDALADIREAVDLKFGKRAMPDSGATEVASELSSPSVRVDLPAETQPAHQFDEKDSSTSPKGSVERDICPRCMGTGIYNCGPCSICNATGKLSEIEGCAGSVEQTAREQFAEQISRLELMADGDPQWDLSDNDRAAIRALLENYRACIGESIRRSK